MEVPMDVSILFKDSPIEKLDQNRLTRITPQRWPALCKAIDRIGELSAKSQNLRRPLTSYDRIFDSDEGQHLYIYWEKPEGSAFSIFLGFLKISRKKLYLRDSDDKQFISSPICILDFYVHETAQNAEIGHQLFEKMLEVEEADVTKIAMDKPNEALLTFLKKYYNLENPVWQTTNFAVFPAFFEELKAEKTDEDGNGMLPPRGRQATADRTMENSRNCSPTNRTRHHDGVGNLFMNETKLQSPQEKYGPETPRGMKNVRDYGHQNIFG
jgi:alpha-tubulin N-acetyltransferase 1